MSRMKGTKAEQLASWESISADIDVVRGAFTHSDFLSRCQAMRRKWEADGLPEKTAWTDSKGKAWNFVTTWWMQWVEKVPEWYVGAAGQAMAPGTNNGAESCIKNTRRDAGNLVASVGEVLDFW